MSRKKQKPRDPMLIEVVAAIGAGRIEIGPIHADDEFVSGLCEGARVKINPAIDVCDSTVHECLHRLRPDWSERAVRSKTTTLMRSLSNAEVDKIYSLVMSVGVTRRKAERL